MEYVVDGRVPPFIKLVMPHSMVLWSGVALTVLMVMFLALTTEKARNKSFSVSSYPTTLDKKTRYGVAILS